MDTEDVSTWIIGIMVLVALILLVLLARGPTGQSRNAEALFITHSVMATI